MPNDIRFVVMTTDTSFYSLLNVALLRSGGLGVISNATSVALAESKFSSDRHNVFMIDIDHIIFNYAQVNRLMGKYRLLTVLVGTSHVQAAPFIKAGFKNFMLKPKNANKASIQSFVKTIKQKIDAFVTGTVKLNRIDPHRFINENQKLIAIASSTGGTDALEKILRALPSDMPPILVVQHMPSGFTKLFANRLNNLCRLKITEAANNDYLCNGVVYIAPAGYHMALAKAGTKLALQCFAGGKVHGVIPAADVLFDSIAPIMKSNAIGIILTGMGTDGAKGLYKMHLNGARTIGQNQATCVVYGMPKVAYDLGAVDVELPVLDIAPAILRLCKT